MQRKIDFSVHEYYHLYNRGTDKRVIFVDEHDYHRFIALLYICNNTDPVDIGRHFNEGKTFADLFTVKRSDALVDVGAYCLMPNHFHLLVREKSAGGITKFMRKLATGYSTYFNNKNARTGSLFEGRFKATHADNDAYLKYLFSYIHLNPIKIIDPTWKEHGITNQRKAEQYLRRYPYSSYFDYLGYPRKEAGIINAEAFPRYFKEFKELEAMTHEWLSFDR